MRLKYNNGLKIRLNKEPWAFWYQKSKEASENLSNCLSRQRIKELRIKLK